MLVAVRKEAVVGMALTFVTPQPSDALAGYYVRADLEGGAQDGGDLWVLGVYMPCEGSPDAALCPSLSAQVQADTKHHKAVVLAGDMNAAYYRDDKSSGIAEAREIDTCQHAGSTGGRRPGTRSPRQKISRGNGGGGTCPNR